MKKEHIIGGKTQANPSFGQSSSLSKFSLFLVKNRHSQMKQRKFSVVQHREPKGRGWDDVKH